MRRIVIEAFALVVITIFLLIVSGIAHGEAAGSQKPNIIFIQAITQVSQRKIFYCW